MIQLEFVVSEKSLTANFFEVKKKTPDINFNDVIKIPSKTIAIKDTESKKQNVRKDLLCQRSVVCGPVAASFTTVQML